ncbi:TIGR01212 family radical SAM protein [Lactococcus hircilactis]|uniref:TIGR01212 family radical SAM protein n=1 Tax=Lactococcus hircilactis TaxID=1494462 RepID=A0A7X2D1L1_9LACT|nr:TIGR01212 family radical SAM protein [Lactococcus hircilactis]MQW40671.1 TIGR01212 family radical SAM protein [Lactococcus hircilactis]
MIKRYTTWNEYLRGRFGEKIFKVPIDAGFDCPNRDGKVAHGGCTFCTVSGSGDMILEPESPIDVQFKVEVEQFHKKWPGVKKYMAYFQNFTNTYAPVEVLRERFEAAVSQPDVVGIAIGTRPDCLPEDVVDYLAELNDRMEVWIDLGLQTTFEKTSRLINRAHEYDVYVDAVARLRVHGIKVCTHLINGLPGETHEMMLENVKRMVLDSDIQGVKLHLLHLMKNTAMQRDYHAGKLKLLSQNEYVTTICDQLELIPKEIVIHRLTGDAPRDSLIGPMWSKKKWEVLNAIDREMECRKSVQGCHDIRKVEKITF